MNQPVALFVRFFLSLLCHALLLPFITDCRFGRRVCRWAWLGLSMVLSVLMIPLILLVKNVGVLFFVEAAGTLILYAVAYVFLSTGNRMRSLFAFTVYGTYFMFLLVLSSCISQGFFAGSHYATTFFRTVFMLFYALALRFLPVVDSFRSTFALDGGWGSPALFSCFSCVTVYATALAFFILRVEVGLRLAVTAVLAALITSSYVVAARMIRLQGQEQAARETESQRKLLESQLAAEREFVEIARARRHDTRHHITLLQDYLEREDLAGMREYLSQYMTELDTDRLERYCVNAVADALLRLTARRCRAEGVACALHCAIPEVLPLTGPELAAVLGNILENAWEAAKKTPDPRMTVKAQTKGGSLLVEVENTVAGPTRFEDDLPVTTKPGGGQGLKSVRRTLEQHGGMLRCTRRDDLFFTQVILPLSAPDGEDGAEFLPPDP